MDAPAGVATAEQTVPAVLLPVTIDLRSESNPMPYGANGFGDIEPEGRWAGDHSAIGLPVRYEGSLDLVLVFEVRSFVWRTELPWQSVRVAINGRELSEWQFVDNDWHEKSIVVPAVWVASSHGLMIEFLSKTATAPSDLGINLDQRRLSVLVRRIHISVHHVAGWIRERSMNGRFSPGRRVGPQARRTYDEKIQSGFWSRFVTGPNVLDIGYRGGDDTALPICEGAIGVDLDYPGYDGRILPFATASQDAVYSSHCLEHIPDYVQAIQEWWRVVKTGGHIITVVPHAFLYERRRRPPSRWNLGHARFYTPASLLAEFEAALKPNTYRVRHLLDEDRGYRYEDPPDAHGSGGYEIELVVEKISPPDWGIQD